MNATIHKRARQQFVATITFFLSVAGLWLIWYEASDDAHFYLWQWSLIFPFLLIISIASIIFPGPRTERMQRGENVSAMGNLKVITNRWWFVIVLAAISGVFHYWYWFVWKYWFLWRNVR
jgi:hypothetical protein